MDDATVTRAIIVWTGHHHTAWPDRQDSSLLGEFGREEGLDLLAVVRQLETEFYASNAWQSTSALSETGDRAAADFRAVHPEIGEAGVQALAWYYTFDHR